MRQASDFHVPCIEYVALSHSSEALPGYYNLFL